MPSRRLFFFFIYLFDIAPFAVAIEASRSIAALHRYTYIMYMYMYFTAIYDEITNIVTIVLFYYSSIMHIIY